MFLSAPRVPGVSIVNYVVGSISFCFFGFPRDQVGTCGGCCFFGEGKAGRCFSRFFFFIQSVPVFMMPLDSNVFMRSWSWSDIVPQCMVQGGGFLLAYIDSSDKL